MSSLSERTGQSRFKRMAELQPSTNLQSESKITYAKRNKPLPLRGTHFMRSNAYDIPSEVPNHETFVPQRYKPIARSPDPDDSPLSEDELEAVYGRSGANASPLIESSNSWTRFGTTSEAPLPPSKKQPQEIANRRCALKPVDPKVEAATPKKKKVLPNTLRHVASIQPPARNAVIIAAQPEPSKDRPVPVRPSARRRIVQSDSDASGVSQCQIPTPVRRLPIGELPMVRSPSKQLDNLHSPGSSDAGIQKRDSIVDSSSPAHKLSVVQAKKETPLTTIRKRLKTSNFGRKPIFPVRQKQKATGSVRVKTERNLGDGFDSQELKTRPYRANKHRRNGTTLVRGIGSLQLQRGPLPDVKFEQNRGVLKTEPANESTCADEDDSAAQTDAPSEATTEIRGQRKVTFSDTFFDEATRAQLSSVSAPKRMFEISSDESEDENDEEDYEEEDDHSEDERPAEQDHEEIKDYDDAGYRCDSSSLRLATPTSFQRAVPFSSLENRVEGDATRINNIATRKLGVTLDFRRAATPGSARQLMRKPRPMEVDEMIIDDPFVEGAGMLSTLDEGEHSYTTSQKRAGEDPSGYHKYRLRSILRPSMPMCHKQNGTRPEDTIANTRRNSNIAIASAHFANPPATPRLGPEAVQLSRSGAKTVAQVEPGAPYGAATRRGKTTVTLADDSASYFGIASDQLQRPRLDAVPQATRTTNQPDAAANHFFNQRRREAELHVLDSSRAVPETSPQRETDYMANCGLGVKVVRRDEDTMRTSSQSLPTVKPMKDLKSLTRSVSREHGTLSQARRRKPTLPFHSPTKAKR